MSVVAVRKYKDKIVIGSDSIRVRGYTQSKKEFCKMVEVEPGFIVSGAGLARDHILLAEFAKTHKPKRASYDGILDWFKEFHDFIKDKVGDSAARIKNDYLVVYKNKVFYFHDYYLNEVEDYEAIGAGMDYALTALYLGKSIGDAIKAACELSIYCEEPVNIIEINK